MGEWLVIGKMDHAMNYLIYIWHKSKTFQIIYLLYTSAWGHELSMIWVLLINYFFLCLCRLPRDTQPGLLRANDASKKLIDLGLEFTPIDQIITDAVESLKSRGYV